MINDLLVVRLTEDRRTGNKHIRTRRGDFADIAGFHAAIHFEADVVAGRIDALAHFTQFIQRLGNKGLAAKARVNRHQQDHVQLIHHVIEVAQRRRRVKHQARFTAVLFDKLQAAIDVFGGFRMEGDNAGAGFGKIRNDAVDRLHHQMHIDRRGNAVFTQRFQYHWADSQVRHIVVIHNVKMDDVGARSQRGGGIFGGPHYSAAKAGVLGLARAMARELGPDNVRVNCITPGLIQTDITAGKLTDDMTANILAGIPMNRLGDAIDIARAALFLGSDLSSYSTGITLDVNGGMLIH